MIIFRLQPKCPASVSLVVVATLILLRRLLHAQGNAGVGAHSRDKRAQSLYLFAIL
jgi:hypothetical protein